MKSNEELRRLDAEVAEALGWTKVETNYPHLYGRTPGGHGLFIVPEWSTDIAAAWPLAERFGLVVGQCFPGIPSKGYLAQTNWRSDESWAQGYGDTACEAICKAVLEVREIRSGG